MFRIAEGQPPTTHAVAVTCGDETGLDGRGADPVQVLDATAAALRGT